MTIPIFGTGLSRSGGGLYSMCLSQHKDIHLACCPNLQIFKSLRTAIIRKLLSKKTKSIDALINRPIDDWYGNEKEILEIENFIINDLDLEKISIDEKTFQEFISISSERGSLECADLAKQFNELECGSFKKVIDSLINIIKKYRDSFTKKYVGFHEVWNIDYFPALARAYPDALFLINIRDIRATISSALGIVNIDPTQVGQVYSYCRHWRKYIGRIITFMKMDLFKNRLLITSHENYVANSKINLENVCNFFNIDFEEKLLNTSEYFNWATGKTWEGNSSFEGHKAVGLKMERAIRWQEKINQDIIELIEYLCEIELRICGYKLKSKDKNIIFNNKLFNTFFKDYYSKVNWESTNRNFFYDLGLELSRKIYLENSSSENSFEEINKTFINHDIYKELKLSHEINLNLSPKHLNENIKMYS